jgi:hypothetical protein
MTNNTGDVGGGSHYLASTEYKGFYINTTEKRDWYVAAVYESHEAKEAVHVATRPSPLAAIEAAKEWIDSLVLERDRQRARDADEARYKANREQWAAREAAAKAAKDAAAEATYRENARRYPEPEGYGIMRCPEHLRPEDPKKPHECRTPGWWKTVFLSVGDMYRCECGDIFELVRDPSGLGYVWRSGSTSRWREVWEQVSGRPPRNGE